MNAKIQSITPEQQAQLPIWHAEWLKIGSETNAADRPRAEAAIARMYSELGESVPQFIWCDSPLTCSAALERLFAELPENAR